MVDQCTKCKKGVGTFYYKGERLCPPCYIVAKDENYKKKRY